MPLQLFSFPSSSFPFLLASFPSHFFLLLHSFVLSLPFVFPLFSNFLCSFLSFTLSLHYIFFFAFLSLLLYFFPAFLLLCTFSNSLLHFIPLFCPLLSFFLPCHPFQSFQLFPFLLSGPFSLLISFWHVRSCKQRKRARVKCVCVCV